MTLFVGIRDQAIAETAITGLRRSINAGGMAGEEQEQVAGQTLYSWPLLPVRRCAAGAGAHRFHALSGHRQATAQGYI
jgi:hypothetical protein